MEKTKPIEIDLLINTPYLSKKFNSNVKSGQLNPTPNDNL